MLEFSPVRKLALAWRISITERKATREDVAFRENDDRSVVTLTHSGWGALGITGVLAVKPMILIG